MIFCTRYAEQLEENKRERLTKPSGEVRGGGTAVQIELPTMSSTALITLVEIQQEEHRSAWDILRMEIYWTGPEIEDD